MKNVQKKIVSSILVIALLSLMFNISGADSQTPANLRVGLFYTESSTGSYTAVSSFTVNAQKGLQLGYVNNNIFNLLYDEPTANFLTIRKDAFYINTNGVLKEYDPATNGVPDVTRIGGFHIQIGSNLPDYNAVMQQVQALKQLGIPAYAAFVDAWQVWTGFYVDQVTAQNDVVTNIQLKLPGVACAIIQPTLNRIVACSSIGETILLFGSDVNRFQIHPKIENTPYMLKINNKSNYRGDLEVRRFTSSDMTVINVLPMDQYLYSVVPSEIGASSHPEALKSQAIAARTYALGRIGKHGKLGFDVCPTVSCQVYKGFDNESPSSNKAVDDTSGKKLIYQGKLVESYFFSSSGGMTEDVKNVWGSSVPYLVSVEDKYESGNSWGYAWQEIKSAAKVKEIMIGKKKDLGDILSVKVTQMASTGRVIGLTITGTRGSQTYTKESCRTAFSNILSQWYTISTDADIIVSGTDTKIKTQLGAQNIMTATGLKQVKSINNNISVVGADGVTKSIHAIPENYTFTGKGWGHAVGMSQEGARGMAKAGFTYEQILTHYYTGATIQ